MKSGETTLSRTRSAHGRLDAVASDRLFRVARIAAPRRRRPGERGTRARLAEAAADRTGRGGPLALLTTHAGIDEIEKLLLRIEHGVYS